MTPCQIRQWLTLLLLLTSAVRAEIRRPHHLENSRDFVCSKVLQDGELEVRIKRGHVSAIETTVELTPEETPAPSDESSLITENPTRQILTLLQVTDGRHFIQMIYDSGWELRDCEYIKSEKSVQEFYESFASDTSCPQNHHQPSNASSFRYLGENDAFFPGPDVMDYVSLKRECRLLHKKVRELAKHGSSAGLQRLKRDLFLYPGTNWCGSGSNARKFNELGYNAAADRCCRDHDHCPYTIEGFTRKFNFFNFRFHTISHCDCDERFRACLKLSSTAAGNMVGKLFFNVVQTKCFLFKHVQKCAKRSWWGKCLKHTKEKMAVLRDALKY